MDPSVERGYAGIQPPRKMRTFPVKSVGGCSKGVTTSKVIYKRTILQGHTRITVLTLDAKGDSLGGLIYLGMNRA